MAITRARAISGAGVGGAAAVEEGEQAARCRKTRLPRNSTAVTRSSFLPGRQMREGAVVLTSASVSPVRLSSNA